jgi:hypothetical protein
MKKLINRYKGYLYIGAVIVAMLLLSRYHHVDGSFGDSLFRAVGIQPWIGINSNSRLHIPVIIGIPLLLVGLFGAVTVYRKRYPKIGSIMAISCIVFALIFGAIAEKAMFLVKRNAVDAASVEITNSNCQFRSEQDEVLVTCTFTIYNYGKVERIQLTPITPEWFEEDEFPEMSSAQLDIQKRSKGSYTIQQVIALSSDSSFSKEFNSVQFEVDVLKNG